MHCTGPINFTRLAKYAAPNVISCTSFLIDLRKDFEGDFDLGGIALLHQPTDRTIVYVSERNSAIWFQHGVKNKNFMAWWRCMFTIFYMICLFL